MPFMTRRSLLTLGVLSGAALLAAAGFVWSGIYNVGADDPHSRPVHALLETMRDRSIAVRAGKLTVPDLKAPVRIVQGAGNYNAMCMGCHLAPGMEESELSRGLSPAPPNLSRETVDAAEAFWAIKHGIKASGMPAWGKSMGDEYVWNMVAFLQQLPELDAARYQALVDSSGGHSHGGGETKSHDHAEDVTDDRGADPHAGMDMNSGKPAVESKPHAHPPGTPADHHETTAPTGPAAEAAPETIERRHADGTVESHPAPPPEQADDGHEHEH